MAGVLSLHLQPLGPVVCCANTPSPHPGGPRLWLHHGGGCKQPPSTGVSFSYGSLSHFVFTAIIRAHECYCCSCTIKKSCLLKSSHIGTVAHFYVLAGLYERRRLKDQNTSTSTSPPTLRSPPVLCSSTCSILVWLVYIHSEDFWTRATFHYLSDFQRFYGLLDATLIFPEHLVWMYFSVCRCRSKHVFFCSTCHQHFMVEVRFITFSPCEHALLSIPSYHLSSAVFICLPFLLSSCPHCSLAYYFFSFPFPLTFWFISPHIFWLTPH